ncbi:Copper sensory histidine kinase CpxA [Pseudoalteromonas luteoviolacea B = ATCC 29581]|nr:Copper sensory histidine kinase CpxA [Pseudoalteromonas luteoviolacea B = ATCC 29581]
MRSLSFQVFLWFWLTILAMLLMLLGFSTLHSSETRITPLPKHALQNLQQIAKNIEKRVADSPQRLTRMIEASPLGRQRWLYLSHSDVDRSLSSRANPPDFDLSLLYYQPMAEPKMIMTERFSAQGPIALKIAEEHYQLYQIHPHRDPPFWVKLRLTTWWQKLIAILIPSLLFSWWFSRRLTGPIKILSLSAKRFAQGDLSARVTHTSKPQFELARLSDDFNEMAQRIEDNMTTQKRLLGDVSHELRSPLTRLMLACGLLESELNNAQQTYLNRIVKEANYLEDMLQNILILSRLEGKAQHLEMTQVPLSQLLQDILSNAQFEAQAKGKQLIIEGSQQISLECDGALLASAIENLLRNAIKYAALTIKIQTNASERTLHITIEDDGPGVDDDALQKLCEPFYRTSDSRSRDSGGIGLGLAIAHRAILAHGGKLELSQAIETGQTKKGLKAIVSLPIT